MNERFILLEIAENLPVSKVKFSRRDLLKGSACFAGAAYLGKESVFRIAEAVHNQIDAKERSRASNNDFIWQNRERLKNVRYGCSFAPEEFGSQGEAEHALKILVEDWGVKDIRIGLRWENVSPDGESIDLSLYRGCVEYALKTGVEIRWSLGAIKNFGWPEFHIPEKIFTRLAKFPAKGEKFVDANTLEQEALKYLEKLSKVLSFEYGKLSSVQGTNEGFKEFGEYAWVADNDFLKQEIEIFDAFFGKPRKLFNSSEWHNLGQIDQSIQLLQRSISDISETADVGIDYYPEKPWVKSFPVLGRPDSILIGQIVAGDPYGRLRDSNYRKEVTEAQMKPWLINGEPVKGATSPGNSSEHLKFVTLRIMENILPSEGGVIYLWGAEELAKRVTRNEGAYRLTPEHLQIVDLIRRVNLGNRGLGNRLAA